MKDLDPIVLFVVLQEMVGGATAWLLLIAALLLAAVTLFASVLSLRRGGFAAQAVAPAAIGLAIWILLTGLLPWATGSAWSNVAGVDWIVLPAFAIGPALVMAAILFDLRVLVQRR